MNSTYVMPTYEAKKARRVYLYKNGSKYAQPKCLVVNDRQVRNFSAFLSRVTSGLRSPVAIRNIYTPTEGHSVNSLEGLQGDHYYVAGGNEHFKKMEYGVRVGETRLLPKRQKRSTEFAIPNLSSRRATISRYNLPIGKPFVIQVFRNGDENYHGARVLLPRNIMGSWEHVLQLITSKAELVTPVKRLCTLDARVIHAVSEIQDGGKYVALEGCKTFQKVAYCSTDERSMSLLRNVPNAAVQQKHRNGKLMALDADRRKREPFKALLRGEPVGGSVPQEGAHLTPPRKKKNMRPMAGRKNKEGREKAMKEQRFGEDSVFGGSPIRDLDESFQTERTPSSPLRSTISSKYKDTITEAISPMESIDTIIVKQTEDVASKGSKLSYNSPTPTTLTGRKSKNTNKRSKVNHTGEDNLDSAANLNITAKEGTKMNKTSSKPRKQSGDSSTHSKAILTSKDKQQLAGSSLVVEKKQIKEDGEMGISVKGIFHADSSSIKTQYNTGEYVEETHGGLFKAKGQRNEVFGAQVVAEGRDTEVEHPIDHLRAEVVEDEEEEPHS